MLLLFPKMLYFSSLSINHEKYYTNDGIHFNSEGINAQAQMISGLSLKLMAASSVKEVTLLQQRHVGK